MQSGSKGLSDFRPEMKWSEQTRSPGPGVQADPSGLRLLDAAIQRRRLSSGKTGNLKKLLSTPARCLLEHPTTAQWVTRMIKSQ